MLAWELSIAWKLKFLFKIQPAQFRILKTSYNIPVVLPRFRITIFKTNRSKGSRYNKDY